MIVKSVETPLFNVVGRETQMDPSFIGLEFECWEDGNEVFWEN